MRISFFCQIVILSLLSSLCYQSFAQITHNSRRFQINNYYYPDQYGNFTRYTAHGYAQQKTSKIAGRLFFLPILTKDDKQIAFIDENGLDFNPKTQKNKAKLARSIVIPVNIKAELPNRYQIPSLASALELGLKESGYLLPVAKGPNNSFLIYPPAAVPSIQPLLEASSKVYEDRVKIQEETITKYNSYKAEIVSLTELEISVFVDNEIITNRKFDKTFISSNGILSNIEVVRPTLYQQNRIASGRYELMVSYKFRDAKTRTIDAQFDAKQIINRFLSESQQAMRSGSSSGWQVLGFGSRRKRVSTSLNSVVKNNYKGDKYEDTVIEMFDASDDMIKQFEQDFFPTLSKERVIENHLLAAEKTDNEQLKKLHLDYAASLKNSDPNLEVDLAKAVASLSAGDYMGFIANGVRWGSHKTSSNSSFRRVLTTDAEISEKKNWSQMRTVSVQHSLTENLKNEIEEKHHPYLGFCGGYQYTYPIYYKNSFGQIQQRMKEGMIISCVQEGGPFKNAGIIPGMIVTAIGGRQVTSDRDLEIILEDYSPGEEIDVTIIEYQGLKHRERDIYIKLLEGVPIKE